MTNTYSLISLNHHTLRNQLIFPYLISLNAFGGCGLIEDNGEDNASRMTLTLDQTELTVGPIFNTGIVICMEPREKDEFQGKEAFQQIVPAGEHALIDFGYTNAYLCFGSQPVRGGERDLMCVNSKPDKKGYEMCDERVCYECRQGHSNPNPKLTHEGLEDHIRYPVRVVHRTRIHKGQEIIDRAVIALGDIPPNAIIGPLSGEIVTEEESTVRVSLSERWDIEPRMMAGAILEGYVVDMTRMSNALSLVRNSCQPNCHVIFRRSKLSYNPKDLYYKVPVLCAGPLGIQRNEELLLDHYLCLSTKGLIRQEQGVGLYSGALINDMLGCIHPEKNDDASDEEEHHQDRNCQRHREWLYDVPRNVRHVAGGLIQ